MFIDTHCHLNFKEYGTDRAMVIGNAKKAGVRTFLNPGVDAYFSETAIALAQKNPGVVFASIGLHPYEAQKKPDIGLLESLLQKYNNLTIKRFNNSPIVAIGECGLDYHQYKNQLAAGRKDNQKRIFKDQLRLALKYDLPVIIHCREAWEDIFSILDNLPVMPRGVFHCFSGGLQELRMAVERKLYLGIDGNVTYSKQLQMIILHVPLESLLLETDAPYLTPVPHRGTRNEPKYLPLIAQKIAGLQKISVKKVEESTTRNAHQLFHLDL